MERQKFKFTKQLWALILSLVFVVQVNAQSTLTVSGVVLDESGFPVIGAAVLVAGTTNGMTTDIDGNFSLSNVPSNGTIQVSYVGYITQDVPVNNQTNLSITLKENTTILDEVVVVGYGVQRKSDLTGSVSSVKASEALATVPSGNITDALQGRMSGVSVLSGSGDPSKDNTIRIRGMNSISGDQGPLVVIDGFIGGSLQNLNPGDVESIEVLKDASATAVYGSRGANGVILVTTKNAKAGKTVVDFNSFWSIKTIAKKPDLLSPYETARLANDYGREYDPLKPTTYFSDSQLEEFRNGEAGYDYFDAIVNDPAMAQNYELSLSNGSEKSSVHASVRYNKTEGVIQRNYKETYNYRLKADTKVKSWLNVGLNFSGYYTSDKGPRISQYEGAILGAMYFPNIVSPYLENGDYNNYYPLGEQAAYNPLGHINESDNKNTHLNNNLQGFADFKIIDGLSFRTQLGVGFTNKNNTSSDNERSYEAFKNGRTRAMAYSSNSKSWLNTNILSYVKEFNQDHRINATAVYEQSYDKTYWHRGTAYNLQPFDNLGSNSLGAGQDKGLLESEQVINSLQSWMLRANYVFKNRYMLTASIRGDGSSRLAKKWDYFPSAAIAWDIKQEKFMEQFDNLSQLKLRVGYGAVGNQSIGAYRIYSQVGVEPDGSYIEARPRGDYLVWERNDQTNVGLDIGFWRGRLTATIEWYKKNTEDVLLDLAQPVHMGHGSKIYNAGKLENQGVELTISGDPIVGKDFSWHTDVTLTYNKGTVKQVPTRNKMQILEGNYEKQIVRLIEGRKMATFWGYNYLGVWTQEELDAPFIDINGNETGETNAQVYKGVQEGESRFEDKNKDGEYNNDDQGEIGCGQPTFNWGWNNTFQYKDFDLSLFIVGFHGFDIYNATEQIGFGLVNGQNFDKVTPLAKFKDRWTEDNKNTDVPRFSSNETTLSSNKFSSRFIEKGDFVKVKSITLGYTLPAALSQKLRINNLRVYASVLNPFMITDYSGMDPEATLGTPLTQGIDWGAYPNSRDFIFGLNFSF